MVVSYEGVAQSQLQNQHVSRSGIQWNAKRRTLGIGGRTIALTPTEYHLLSTLRYGVPVTYTNLVQAVYNCALDEKVRLMLDKHIDRIRGKLRGTGIYIYCVLTYGYLLFNEIVPEEEEAILKGDRR
jgi:DNA-binding response OmpR family regulator